MGRTDRHLDIKVDSSLVLEECRELDINGTNFSVTVDNENETAVLDLNSENIDAKHKTYDQLVHRIAEDSYTEIIRSGSRVTDIIIWTDSGKTKKIREENITYSGNKVNTVTTKQYDGSGVVINNEIYVETYNYTGGIVTSINGELSGNFPPYDVPFIPS